MKRYNELSREIFKIPNLLTMSRLLILPFFVYYYLFETNYIVTVIIFAFAGITDVLDGYIARSKNMVTQFGTVLDPLVDKVFQLVVAVCIALKGFYSMWIITGFLILKDLTLILSGVFLYKQHKKIIKANIVGKFSSFVFYTAVFAIILFPDYALQYRFAIEISVVSSGAIALLSYIFYGIQIIKSLRNSKNILN